VGVHRSPSLSHRGREKCSAVGRGDQADFPVARVAGGGILPPPGRRPVSVVLLVAISGVRVNGALAVTNARLGWSFAIQDLV